LPLLYRISAEVAERARNCLFINFDQKRRSELERLRKLLHQLVDELEKLEENRRRFSVAVFARQIQTIGAFVAERNPVFVDQRQETSECSVTRTEHQGSA
jgi:hypothetical protein